jgi:hypothetical protein
MDSLPQHIKEIFYKALNEEIPVHEFEQWLYKDKELESFLNEEDYLDLISLNYKNDSKYDIYNQLKRHIDLGEFEKYKILNLLSEAQMKSERLPYILMEFYDLYCSGFDFLHNLAIDYGLQVETAGRHTSEGSWESLGPIEQKEFLDSLSPGLDKELEKVIGWIEEKKIVFTGIDDREADDHLYLDLRSDEERP